MSKGKRPAKIAGRGVKDTGPKYVTVMVREMYKKPSGNWGCRTRWEKREKSA